MKCIQETSIMEPLTLFYYLFLGYFQFFFNTSTNVIKHFRKPLSQDAMTTFFMSTRKDSTKNLFAENNSDAESNPFIVSFE